MQNPLIDQQHLKEYFLNGLLAATGFTVFVIIFLLNKQYENFYLLYVGNIVFMTVAGFYTYRLINRLYEGKRSVSMLIAGHLAVVTGIVIALIFFGLLAITLFPGFNAAQTVTGTPDNVQSSSPAGLAFMILMNTVLANLAVGSFIVVIISYAGKRNQVKDKPTSLETNIPHLHK